MNSILFLYGEPHTEKLCPLRANFAEAGCESLPCREPPATACLRACPCVLLRSFDLFRCTNIENDKFLKSWTDLGPVLDFNFPVVFPFVACVALSVLDGCCFVQAEIRSRSNNLLRQPDCFRWQHGASGCEKSNALLLAPVPNQGVKEAEPNQASRSNRVSCSANDFQKFQSF